jgi:hypothetical protein
MKATTPLLLFALAAFGGVAVLGACTPKPQGLFADTSPPVSVSNARTGSTPRFVGRWSTGAGLCRNPMIIRATALHDGAIHCEFAKIENASAGYSIDAVCHAGRGPEPGRLTLTLPDPTHMRSITLAGGPFKNPVALERCS